MSASFASSKWTDELSGQLRDSAKVRTESMSWVFGPLVFVVDPDADHDLEATALRIDLHEGAAGGVTVVPMSDVTRAPFAIGGSLARWKTVFAGSQSMVDGILQSRLRVRGDLPTLMRHRGLLDAIAVAGGTIETVWQDEKEAAAAPT